MYKDSFLCTTQFNCSTCNCIQLLPSSQTISVEESDIIFTSDDAVCKHSIKQKSHQANDCILMVMELIFGVSHLHAMVVTSNIANSILPRAGFNSLFLYRRLYRCYTQLNGFSFDHGNVERKTDLTLEEFHQQYDGQKPVCVFSSSELGWIEEVILVKDLPLSSSWRFKFPCLSASFDIWQHVTLNVMYMRNISYEDFLLIHGYL